MGGRVITRSHRRGGRLRRSQSRLRARGLGLCRLIVALLLVSPQAGMGLAAEAEPTALRIQEHQSCPPTDPVDPDSALDTPAAEGPCEDGAESEAGTRGRTGGGKARPAEEVPEGHDADHDGPPAEEVVREADESEEGDGPPAEEETDSPRAEEVPEGSGSETDDAEEDGPPAEEETDSPRAEEVPEGSGSETDDAEEDGPPAEEETDSPRAGDSGSDDSGAREPPHCVRTWVYVACSIQPGSLVDPGASPDGGDETAAEGAGTPSPPPSRHPGTRPEQPAEVREQADVPPERPTGVSSQQLEGSHNTAALLRALQADPRGGGDLAPSAFAPFIIAGRASWVNTWGAPRVGPGDLLRQHEGQDVFCDHGAPVLASQDGIVEFDAGGLGGTVARVHRPDGAYWYYAHLSAWNTEDLASGDAVVAGDVIGYCGNTGNAAATAPHVHFGLYGRDGRALDPMAWLVRWLRAAERSAGLRAFGSAPQSPPGPELTGDGDNRTAPSFPAARAATRRTDVVGDAARSLSRAGIPSPNLAEGLPSTLSRSSEEALEFIGIGLVLAMVYVLRTGFGSGWGARERHPRGRLHEGGGPGG